jgi:hypothetical protein
VLCRVSALLQCNRTPEDLGVTMHELALTGLCTFLTFMTQGVALGWYIRPFQGLVLCYA